MFRCFLITGITALLLPGALLWAGDPPLFVSVYDFSATGRFDRARVTELELVTNGTLEADSSGRITKPRRYRTRNSQLIGTYQFSRPAENESTLFGDLQRLALLEMLRDGYISKTLFDAVTDATALWHPGQVRFAVTWSELSLEQARTLFAGKIPWDRVMGAPTKGRRQHEGFDPGEVWGWEAGWDPQRPLKIVRSSVMLGIGQRFSDAQGWHPAPMAWQEIPLHADVAHLDRTQLPFVAEFSRAVAETGPLPGSLREPLEVLLGTLDREARILGVSPTRYLLFARALDQRHAIHFMRQFGMRHWDKEMHAWFQANPDDALAYFPMAPLSKPLPVDSILMTTLEHVKQFLPVDNLSERDHQLRLRSHGTLTLKQARELQERFQENLWNYFQFRDFHEARNPVCTWDCSSLLTQGFLTETMRQLGIREDSVANGLLNYLQGMGHWELNTFSSFWEEGGFILSRKKENDKSLLGIRIDNLSEEAARAHPVSYVATVLLSIQDHFVRRIERASPLVRYNLLRLVAGSNPSARPKQPSLHDARDIIAQFPFYVGTSSAFLSQELASLGGEKTEADIIGVPKVTVDVDSGPNLEFDAPGKAALFRFSSNQIDQVRARLPRLALPNTVSCPAFIRAMGSRTASHY